MDKGDKFTAIIAFRTSPSLKCQLMEEAVCKGKNLSEYIYELIEAGWEQIKGEDVKQERKTV